MLKRKLFIRISLATTNTTEFYGNLNMGNLLFNKYEASCVKVSK